MFNLVGLGNALVDIEILVSEEEFSSLGLVKNSMTLGDDTVRKSILEKLEHNDKKFSSGGAVGNTVCALAKQGNRVGLIGFVGNDFHGDKYLEDLKKIGVEFLGKRLDGETGTSLVLITPDGNRTMLTTLGCASNLEIDTLQEVCEGKKGKIENFLIESYLLFGEVNIGKVRKLVDDLKKQDTTTILSDSDAFCVEQEPAIYEELFEKVDVIFINGEQAKAMKKLDREDPTGVDMITKEISARAVRPKMIVITDQANGAYIASPQVVHIPVIPTNVVDSTGAGDGFAAGVLDGFMKGLSASEMGRQGATIASEVISRYGARW